MASIFTSRFNLWSWILGCYSGFWYHSSKRL